MSSSPFRLEVEVILFPKKRAPSQAIFYICKNYEYEKDIFVFSNVHFAGVFYAGAKSQCV